MKSPSWIGKRWPRRAWNHACAATLVVVAVVAAVAAVAVVPTGTRGQGITDDLYISGFVSQGYFNTARNDFLVRNSRKGTAEFNEAAVIVVAEPMDRLRVGIQLLARDLGNVGNNNVVVDWAYGDYRWRDWLGVRGGKIKIPYGLYNQARDVDMLRTTVFLPQGVYNERFRDLDLACEGIGAYGNVLLGSGGDLDYEFYGGTLNISDAGQGFWIEEAELAGRAYTEIVGLVADDTYDLEPGTSEATFQGSDDPDVSFPYYFGGSLVWNTPLDGLRTGGTLAAGKFDYLFQLNYIVDVPGDLTRPKLVIPFSFEVDASDRIHHIWTASAEYARNDWTFAAEYSRWLIGEGPEEEHWYVQADRRLNERLSLATYYSVSHPDVNHRKGEDAPPGVARYYAWQRDLAAALRVDINAHWLVKLEYHYLDGAAGARIEDPTTITTDPAARYWSMVAAKMTFHF